MRRSAQLATLLVLGGFVAASLWLLNRTRASGPEEYLPPLTTLSPQADGAQALYELAQQAGLPVQRYHDTEYDYPKYACMVVLTGGEPQLGMLGGMDAKALRLWLEDGGRLVVADPGNEFSVAGDLLDELDAHKVEFARPASRIATRGGAGKPGRIAPLALTDASGEVYKLAPDRPAAFRDVRSIEVAQPQFPSDDWAKTAPLLSTQDSSGSDAPPVLLYRKVGKGEFYWLTRPEMLANAWLPRADNHRFALALLSMASQGKPVLFDEHIHGYEHATPGVLAVLTHTIGGHLLLGLIALTALLFAGAAVRPAKFTVETVPARRQGAEMVLAQADLYRRAGARHVVAETQLDGLRRAYMASRALAHPPSDGMLLAWISEDWRTEPERKSLLAEYVNSRLLPRTTHALLALTQACDQAKLALREGTA